MQRSLVLHQRKAAEWSDSMDEPARSEAEIDDGGGVQQWWRFPDGHIKTRIGELHFDNGYPNVTTVEALFDELDFQRACQAYLWALPLVSMAQSQYAVAEAFSMEDCDLLQSLSYQSKLGVLTANAAAPDIGLFPNMARTGPIIVEVPPGAIVGMVNDFWQRPLADLGLTGRDAGKGGKYLFVGPNTPVPAASGFIITRSATNNLMIAVRIVAGSAAGRQSLLDRVRVYPFARRRSPPARRVHDAGSRIWSSMPPRGLAYWERLHAILQEEPVEERDRFFTAMLRPLGIEKGKPFFPGDVESNILTEATLVGEAMARANDYDKRFDGVRLWSGRRWESTMSFDPMQRNDYFEHLDERAAWFYEAVGSSASLRTKTPGFGQVCLCSYKDRDGSWLVGGQQYRLVVPPYVPAKESWSITGYDNDTRALIENPSRRADLSAGDDLLVSPDGSVTVSFGPRAPGSGTRNWIETLPGHGWFAYFRLLAPTERFFDRGWQLPDIERVG
jgi:hypothetical protein